MALLTDLALHPKLFKALDKLGFSEATDVQAQAIPIALTGKDLMVSAKTGSGKTAAFVLPTLNRLLATDAPSSATRALILLPTRELALQTQKMVDALASFTAIKSGLVIGGEAFKHQVATLRKNPEILIATPGRLVEHIEKGTPDFSDLEVLILDEADRMLDMGFAEDMTTIAGACNPQRQNLLFSATLKHKGFAPIEALLTRPESVVTDSHRQAHAHIRQQVVLADDDRHKERLITALVNEEQASRVIVFCKTREQCQQLGSTLKHHGLSVGYLHGEIAQSIRKQVMSRFRDGKTNVLVATDVAARGLDIQNVDLVINHSVAHSGDEHVHRVGRTGRAGQAGTAITLVNALEFKLMSSIERYLKIRFETRRVVGLKANYQGPKKVKKSGKPAGVKKTLLKSKKAAEKKKAARPKHAARKAAQARTAAASGKGKPGTAKAAATKADTAAAKRPAKKATTQAAEGMNPLRKRK